MAELTKQQLDKARAWMRKHMNQYKDNLTEEYNCTKLAEDCCDELELYETDGGEENVPEELFNISFQVTDFQKTD